MLATWICQKEAWSEKVNVFNLIKKEEKNHAEVAKIYGKN